MSRTDTATQVCDCTTRYCLPEELKLQVEVKQAVKEWL